MTEEDDNPDAPVSEIPTYSILVFRSKEMPEEYHPVIFSKWLHSLRYGNPLFKSIEQDEFYKQYHRYIENLLAKPDSITRLAVLSDDKDIVLGFSVCREDVLDYVYVHKDNRKLGIAKSLVPPEITTFSHVTVLAMDIWRKNQKYEHLKFNPFA